MPRMGRIPLSSLALVLGSAVVACQAISGLGDFGLDEAQPKGGSGGATGSATVGSGTGGTGKGGASASSSASGTTSGTGGMETSASASTATSSSSSSSSASASSSSTGQGGGTSCPYYVFLSANEYQVSAGGVNDFDAHCNTEAGAAALPGVWKAIVSSNVPAAMRIDASCDVYLQKDQFNMQPKVADAGKLFMLPLQHAISTTAGGQPPIDANSIGGGAPVPLQAWTGAHAGGTLGATCGIWTSTQNAGTVGSPFAVDSTWLDAGMAPCLQGHHLYCIKQGN